MFFDRVWIKENSRNRLHAPDRRNAVLVAFLALLLGGIYSSGGSFDFDVNTGSFEQMLNEESGSAEIAYFIMLLLPTLLFASLIALGIQIFFSNVLAVGTDGWFMCFARGESPSVGTMFGSFKFYGRALSATLLVNIYTFLWSLLFVIPGIVKGYAYSMTNYILCNNPNLSASQAIYLSQRLTDGHKGDLFILDLSFFGWNLLNAFTFGLLGIFYLNPYYQTARAGAYLSLKQMAIADGRMSPADFGDDPAEYATLEGTAQ